MVIPEGVEGDEAGARVVLARYGGVSVGQGGGEAGRAGGGKADAGGHRHGHMVYTAPIEAAATERFLEFAEARGSRYPAIVKLWENAWAEFVPFLAFDAEIRRIICSTNAIESVNARIRRAARSSRARCSHCGCCQIFSPVRR